MAFPPSFYSICDSLGIVVLLDLNFACATYPPTSLKSHYTEEAIQARQLAERHPSIVLIIGDNEFYSMMKEFPFRDSDKRRLVEDFNARSHLLRTLLQPTLPFLNTSPSSLEEIHYYNYLDDCESTTYPKVSAVLEFGWPSLSTDMGTTTQMDPSASLTSPAFLDAFKRHPRALEEVMRSLRKHFDFRVPVLGSLQIRRFVMLTQVQQGRCLERAIQSWSGVVEKGGESKGGKRKGKTEKEGGKNDEKSKFGTRGGLLMWQLNDADTHINSWSVLNHDKSPKASYWILKRALHASFVVMQTTPSCLRITSLKTSMLSTNASATSLPSFQVVGLDFFHSGYFEEAVLEREGEVCLQVVHPVVRVKSQSTSVYIYNSKLDQVDCVLQGNVVVLTSKVHLPYVFVQGCDHAHDNFFHVHPGLGTRMECVYTSLPRVSHLGSLTLRSCRVD